MDPRRCAEHRELISAFIDGEISPSERIELRAHLAACPECAALLESYRSIGDRIRTLTPVHAPEYLTDAIFAQTIDAEPKRLLLITSRVGYSMAAIAAVALIFVVSGYLIMGGYQRATRPAVASSAPEEQRDAPWPLQDPIEISFNKPMDQSSVEAALAIQPAGEDERLGRHWDGNTLVIGRNETLRPDTTYQIKITSDARDAWGNRLEPPFSLNFTTASSVVAFQTPTPPPPTPVAPTEVPDSPTTPVVQATSAPIDATRPADPASVPATVVATATPTPQAVGTAGQDDPQPPDAPTSTPSAPDPVATSTPPQDDWIDDIPTPTPTLPPATTVTPTPTPTPTMTPTVAPTSTPLPTATATVPPAISTPTAPPAPTATPDTYAVTGAIGNVYWGDEAVRDRLGKAVDVARTASAQVQGFQRGNMFYRGDVDMVYILATTGWWTGIASDVSPPYPDAEPAGDGLWEPGGLFGYHWNTTSWIEDDLGYATSAYASSFSSTLQEFERGVIMLGVNSIYVLYIDASTAWEFYPLVQ